MCAVAGSKGELIIQNSGVLPQVKADKSSSYVNKRNPFGVIWLEVEDISPRQATRHQHIKNAVFGLDYSPKDAEAP